MLCIRESTYTCPRTSVAERQETASLERYGTSLDQTVLSRKNVLCPQGMRSIPNLLCTYLVMQFLILLVGNSGAGINVTLGSSYNQKTNNNVYSIAHSTRSTLVRLNRGNFSFQSYKTHQLSACFCAGVEKAKSKIYFLRKSVFTQAKSFPRTRGHIHNTPFSS